MKKNKSISVKDLNRAMGRSLRKATRTNKALGLDTVLLKGNIIVRVTPKGDTKKLDKLSKTENYANGPIKLN